MLSFNPLPGDLTIFHSWHQVTTLTNVGHTASRTFSSFYHQVQLPSIQPSLGISKEKAALQTVEVIQQSENNGFPHKLAKKSSPLPTQSLI